VFSVRSQRYGHGDQTNTPLAVQRETINELRFENDRGGSRPRIRSRVIAQRLSQTARPVMVEEHVSVCVVVVVVFGRTERTNGAEAERRDIRSDGRRKERREFLWHDDRRRPVAGTRVRGLAGYQEQDRGFRRQTSREQGPSSSAIVIGLNGNAVGDVLRNKSF